MSLKCSTVLLVCSKIYSLINSEGTYIVCGVYKFYKVCINFMWCKYILCGVHTLYIVYICCTCTSSARLYYSSCIQISYTQVQQIRGHSKRINNLFKLRMLKSSLSHIFIEFFWELPY